MRAGRWLACALLVVACQQPKAAPHAPPAPAAATPPAKAATICERPARPAVAAKDAKVDASFRAFARTWLDKMAKAGATPRGGVRRQPVPDRFETELRPTQSKVAPWVGILRYCEQTLQCTSAAPASCKISKGTSVTEIFRLQEGKWTY